MDDVTKAKRPRRLVDWPWVMVRVECEPCRYDASYRLAELAERHGAAAELIALLDGVKTRCRLIDRGHGRRQPAVECCIRYRVPPGGPMPEGAAAREEVAGDRWPPQPRRAPAERKSTVGEMRDQGITHLNLHCYGIDRHGVTCHRSADVTLDALGLPDDAPYTDVRRRGLRCTRCGHRWPSIAPRWPDPRKVHARRMRSGEPVTCEVNGIVVPRYSDPLATRPTPENPTVPSMPDLSLYDVVEEDDGTYAVV